MVNTVKVKGTHELVYMLEKLYFLDYDAKLDVSEEGHGYKVKYRVYINNSLFDDVFEVLDLGDRLYGILLYSLDHTFVWGEIRVICESKYRQLESLIVKRMFEELIADVNGRDR